MGLGTNYDKRHATTVRFIRTHLCDFCDDINWTSDPTPWSDPRQAAYNCFGFAMDSRKWWQNPAIPGDPEGDPRYHWPEHLIDPTDANPWVANYVAAAEFIGFSDCGQDDSWEEGHEKILLIHQRGLFVHAILQISATRWKSKMGELSDFEHSLDSIKRAYPGHRLTFMKRPRCQRSMT